MTIFKNISSLECIILVLQLIQMRVCIPQECVVYQGEIGLEMYIIVCGLVGVYIEKEGQKEHVASLIDGHVFGERALLFDEVRNATVKCVTFTELLVFGKEDFLQVAQSYPELFEAVTIEVERKVTLSAFRKMDIKADTDEYNRSHATEDGGAEVI